MALGTPSPQLKQHLLVAHDADGQTDPFPRYTAGVSKGIFKYKKTGTGSCTITLRDADTDAELWSFVAASGGTTKEAINLDLTDNYYAEQSATSGSVAVDAYVECRRQE